MTEFRFLKLLWIYVAVTVASMIAVLFHGYSDELSAAYDNEPEPWLLQSWIGWTVIGGFAVAWIVGLIGLFYIKPWARSLSLYSTLAGFLLFPLSGPSLYSGIELALADGASILWGAILAISYFSPVSERFGR
jgi:hypothetical protein